MFFVKPPATPHASSTGAVPGARQGFDLVQSPRGSVPWRLKVRNAGSLIVGAFVLPQRLSTQFVVFPVQCGHPMEQPWENHMQAKPSQPPVQ
ncbi:MAG: hypothetical protein CMN64_22855 [Sphingobium sp.]|nr:hypothetical protein [Sphingobium sp.]